MTSFCGSDNDESDYEIGYKDGYQDGAGTAFGLMGMAEAIRLRYPKECPVCYGIGGEWDDYTPDQFYVCNACDGEGTVNWLK